MPVKDRGEMVEALDRAQAALRAAAGDLEATKASMLSDAAEPSGMTIAQLAAGSSLSHEALMAFVQTVSELLGEKALDVQAARRAGILAAAAQTWEGELGPLLSSAQVRELLGGVARQRVDELLRARRLIGLRDSTGRRRYPLFQFNEGRALQPLVDAYWTLCDAPISEWSAASWCVSPDAVLEGRSPAAWARAEFDAERLARIARQDAARLAQ